MYCSLCEFDVGEERVGCFKVDGRKILATKTCGSNISNIETGGMETNDEGLSQLASSSNSTEFSGKTPATGDSEISKVGISDRASLTEALGVEVMDGQSKSFWETWTMFNNVLSNGETLGQAIFVVGEYFPQIDHM